jgi:DNA (cytosine-5)-methyltransferase 1
MKPTVADLFCGMGGFSKGFEMAGFKVLFGIDNWPAALETFQKNLKDTRGILADLTRLDDKVFEEYRNKVDVLLAGPPCQGFTIIGKRDINDPRNSLFEEVVRATKIIKPKVVVIENVVGLLSMKNPNGRMVRDLIIERLEGEGYFTECRILNAADYGVPQNRKRVIFIGSKIGKVGFPEPSKKFVTVGEALGNIPDAGSNTYLPPMNEYQKLMCNGATVIYNHEMPNHNPEIIKRMSFVPPGGNWRDIPKEYYNVGGKHSNNYRRLDPKAPSITIKHATKSMIIHPWYNRCLTVREAARLQSFPDNFIIYGTKFEQHQQLANAVPPLLARAIAEHILSKLNSINPKPIIQKRLHHYASSKKLETKEETKKSNKKFTFIDLFSGIGGFRIAFERVGGICVFSSDIDKWANETYFLNFGEWPRGDITKIPSSEIPDFDVLCAGFPCQAFSIAGRRLGFADTRGTLFFEIERILRDKKPQAFILENVKGLVNHDKGNTFETIKNSLKKLGYNIFYKVLNAKDYGLPQNRERIFIVGFRKNVNFRFPPPTGLEKTILDILDKNVSGYRVSKIALKHIKKFYKKFVGTNRKNNGFPTIATEIRPSRCIMRNDGISPCLTAKMGTGGNNIPVIVEEGRKLTVKECLRLMGFPENFKIKENRMQSYKQVGNSVPVPIVEAIAKEMVKYLE